MKTFQPSAFQRCFQTVLVFNSLTEDQIQTQRRVMVVVHTLLHHCFFDVSWLLVWLKYRHDQIGDGSQHMKTHDGSGLEFMSSLLQDLDYWCRVCIALIALIPQLALIPTIYYCKLTDKIWYWDCMDSWILSSKTCTGRWFFCKKGAEKTKKLFSR